MALVDRPLVEHAVEEALAAAGGADGGARHPGHGRQRGEAGAVAGHGGDAAAVALGLAHPELGRDFADSVRETARAPEDAAEPESVDAMRRT